MTHLSLVVVIILVGASLIRKYLENDLLQDLYLIMFGFFFEKDYLIEVDF